MKFLKAKWKNKTTITVAKPVFNNIKIGDWLRIYTPAEGVLCYKILGKPSMTVLRVREVTRFDRLLLRCKTIINSIKDYFHGNLPN